MPSINWRTCPSSTEASSLATNTLTSLLQSLVQIPVWILVFKSISNPVVRLSSTMGNPFGPTLSHPHNTCYSLVRTVIIQEFYPEHFFARPRHTRLSVSDLKTTIQCAIVFCQPTPIALPACVIRHFTEHSTNDQNSRFPRLEGWIWQIQKILPSCPHRIRFTDRSIESSLDNCWTTSSQSTGCTTAKSERIQQGLQGHAQRRVNVAKLRTGASTRTYIHTYSAEPFRSLPDFSSLSIWLRINDRNLLRLSLQDTCRRRPAAESLYEDGAQLISSSFSFKLTAHSRHGNHRQFHFFSSSTSASVVHSFHRLA